MKIINHSKQAKNAPKLSDMSVGQVIFYNEEYFMVVQPPDFDDGMFDLVSLETGEYVRILETDQDIQVQPIEDVTLVIGGSPAIKDKKDKK